MRLPRIAPARVVPRAGARALRLAYVAVIAIATLRGLAPSGDVRAVASRLWRALHPALRPADAVDAARNVVLFAGFGAVWLATAAPGRLRRALLRATVVGAVVSASVEAAQLFSPARFASVLDVVTNTAGAFVGALGVAVAVAAARARRPVWLAPSPLALVALPYAAACALEAFSPLGRPDELPDAWGGPGRRWATAVAHLRAHSAAAGGVAEWVDPLLFAPAGALAVLAWVERGGRPWRAAAAASAGLALVWGGAEVLRGVAGGDLSPRAAGVRAAATLAGAVAAAFAAAPGGGAGAARVRAWLARRGPAALAAALLAWSWRPFGPVNSLAAAAARFGGDALVPLAAFVHDYSLHSVADVLVGFLLYVPVGAWLAGRGAAGARVRALWPGVVLAVVAEAGQAFVAARTLDVTDALVQSAGVFLGWAVVRQAEALRAARRPAVTGVRAAVRDGGAPALAS